MAGMFYTLEETAQKLGKSEEEVRSLVSEGQLREFRDGPKILFKVDDVNAIADQASSVSPEESQETSLDEDLDLLMADDDTQVGESPSEAEQPIEPQAPEKQPQPAVEDQTPDEQPVVQEESETLELDETQADQPVPDQIKEASGTDEQLAQPDSSETDAILLQSDESKAPAETPQEDELAEITDADTAVTSAEGINLLEETDSSYDLADDSLGDTKEVGSGPTKLDEIDEDVNLDTFGSGSGLLDLSLQADDTSLGGILDEIYTPEGEEDQPAPGAGASGELAMGSGAADVLTEEAGLADAGRAPAVPMAAMYAEPEPDSASNLLGMMLLLPLLAVIYTGIVAITSFKTHTAPSILEPIKGMIVYVIGGLGVLALIIGISGCMMGGQSGPKKPKAKKEKPPKKEKKKKPKKEKKPKKKKG